MACGKKQRYLLTSALQLLDVTQTCMVSSNRERQCEFEIWVEIFLLQRE